MIETTPQENDVTKASIAFATGLALATVASGGIVAERLSGGDLRVAFGAHVLSSVAALGVLLQRRNESGVAVVALQAVGAALGILATHYLLRSSQLGVVPEWMAEGPAQLVNDGVAVFAPLAVIAAASRRRPNTIVLAATLVLVTAYRATAFMWHLDAIRFVYSVQDLVTGELAGAALAIATFRLLAR